MGTWNYSLAYERLGRERTRNGGALRPQGTLLAHAHMQLDMGRPLIAPAQIAFPRGL